MNRVNIERNFDKAENAINNAVDDSLKDLERFLKSRLRQVINVKFNKITGTLLKSVQARIKKQSEDNRHVYVGCSRDAFYSLFLDKGTGDRKHRKTGKSVGSIKPTRFVRKFYDQNKAEIREIITKYIKRIWYYD